MNRVGAALLAASIAFAGVARSVAGPCSDDIARLDRQLGYAPAKPAKDGKPSKPPPKRPQAEARYDPPLELARKLDAEDNADCHKAVTEVEMLISQ
jgi:hypothetical protein